MKVKENGQVIGEVIEKEKKTKATHYKSSNKFIVNYLISMGMRFEEDIEENFYNGKTGYTFAFPTDQEGFTECIEVIKECRKKGEHYPFPEVDGNQLTFKTSNKERWLAIEVCFPSLRRD